MTHTEILNLSAWTDASFSSSTTSFFISPFYECGIEVETKELGKKK
jgi:hypothetical protein